MEERRFLIWPANVSNTSALVKAILDGNIQLSCDLLNQGADINAPDDEGRTPLMASAYIGNEEILSTLLDAGADINQTTIHKDTALHYSAENNSEKGTRLLIEKGADVNVSDKHGQTPLFLAAKNTNEQIARLLIEKGADVNVPDQYEETPLFLAAENTNQQIARLLIEKGADVNVSAKNGQTPLFLAAENANEQIAGLLIEKGADVNESDEDGQTPIFLAAKNMNEQIAGLLIEEGAYVNVSAEDGQTPLFRAAENTNEQVTRLLIEKGADVNASAEDGQTPLIIATEKATKGVVRLLIENDADVLARNKKGETPIINAVLRCKGAQTFLDIAGILVDNGAVLHDADMCNVSVISHFLNRHCHEVYFTSNVSKELTFFKVNGVDDSAIFRSAVSNLYAIIPQYQDRVFSTEKTTITKNVEVASMYASDEGLKQIESIKVLLQENKIPRALQTLISLGANPNSANSDGNTALHHAVLLPFFGVSIERTMDILHTLKSHGAKFNVRNHDRETPLHFFLSNAWTLAEKSKTWIGMDSIEEICSFLMNDASVIAETTKAGETLFHLTLKLLQMVLSMDDNSRREAICHHLEKLLKSLSDKCGQQSTILKQTDENGDSVLHLWASLSMPQGYDYTQHVTKTDTFQILLENLLKCLLKPGMTPNRRNRKEQTPLHNCRTWAAVKLLIKSGANANDLDKKGRTPLQNMAERNQFAVISGNVFPDVAVDQKTFFQELVSLGLDIWSSDKDTKSTLSVVLESESYVLAKALIDVAVVKCNSATILKQMLETVCKDGSAQTTWKNFLTKRILTSTRSPLKSGLNDALHYICTHIARLHRQEHTTELGGERQADELRTHKDSNVFMDIARQLLFYGANGKQLCDDFPTLRSFLTAAVSLEKMEKIIPWTSHCKCHKEKLESVSRKQNVEKIGTYCYHVERIGQGYFGDVFAGICETDAREVAIKKMKKSLIERPVDAREKSILVEVADCTQVVSYIHFDNTDKDFVYIVLELMEGHLDSYLESPLFDANQSVHQCKEIVQGLHFLHQHKPYPILHRDLKPENILYKFDINGKLCLKIADFGLSGPLEVGMTTVLHSKAGTRCWIAPEVVQSSEYKQSISSDIFACGLLLHYILSPKKHPFRPKDCNNKSEEVIDLQTRTNMMNYQMEGWSAIISPDASHLIKGMLHKDESQRPSAADVLRHPLFWSNKKKLAFLIAVGNQHVFECPPDVKAASHYPKTGVEAALEGKFNSIVSCGAWNDPSYKDMTQVVVEMTKPVAKVNKKGKTITSNPRTYDYGSIVDLVRFIRNAIAHVSEQSRPQEIKKLILEDAVFLKEFPNLLIEVYVAVTKYDWNTREEIKHVMTSEEQDS